jgi:hypothetical protein
MKSIFSNLAEKLSQTRVVVWIKDEFKEARFIHAALVMAAMGWMPSLWSYMLPVMVIYGAVKYKAVGAYFSQLLKSIGDFFDGSKEEHEEAQRTRNANKSFLSLHIGRWIGNKFNSSPLNVAKFFFSFYILVMSTMPWSMFMIYALYRPKTEVLEAIYKQFQSMTNVVLGFFKGLSNVQKVIATLIAVSITSGILSSLFATSGLLGVFDVAMTVAMLGLTVAGFRLAMTDFARAISRPLTLITNKIGILLGMIGGNRLAHTFFFGKISGSLGPTYGSVQSGGLFQSLYKMAFSTNPYGSSQFFFSNTVGGAVFNRLSTGAGGLLGSIFFSYDLSTYGTLNGVLGPTSYQLFVFMALGAAVGYFIDKAVDRVSKSFYADAQKTWENNPEEGKKPSRFVNGVKAVVNFANNYRVPFSGTLAVTGLMYYLRMPMYITVLHRTSSPLVSLILIEGAMLIPALLTTKTYRELTKLCGSLYHKYLNRNNKIPTSADVLLASTEQPTPAPVEFVQPLQANAMPAEAPAPVVFSTQAQALTIAQPSGDSSSSAEEQDDEVEELGAGSALTPFPIQDEDGVLDEEASPEPRRSPSPSRNAVGAFL